VSRTILRSSSSTFLCLVFKPEAGSFSSRFSLPITFNVSSLFDNQVAHRSARPMGSDFSGLIISFLSQNLIDYMHQLSGYRTDCYSSYFLGFDPICPIFKLRIKPDSTTSRLNETPVDISYLTEEKISQNKSNSWYGHQPFSLRVLFGTTFNHLRSRIQKTVRKQPSSTGRFHYHLRNRRKLTKIFYRLLFGSMIQAAPIFYFPRFIYNRRLRKTFVNVHNYEIHLLPPFGLWFKIIYDNMIPNRGGSLS